MTKTDWRDIVFKAMWTGVAAVLGYIVVSLANVTTWWAPVAVMAATAALAFVRQRAGATPT